MLSEHVRNGNNHPVHLHGYKFQVVKMGWPEYNDTTGFMEKSNTEITCNNSFCNNLKWSNDSWSGGNIPDMVESGPTMKDTVVVPIGGYTVIRFKADNPGIAHLNDKMQSLLILSIPLIILHHLFFGIK